MNYNGSLSYFFWGPGMRWFSVIGSFIVLFFIHLTVSAGSETETSTFCKSNPDSDVCSLMNRIAVTSEDSDSEKNVSEKDGIDNCGYDLDETQYPLGAKKESIRSPFTSSEIQKIITIEIMVIATTDDLDAKGIGKNGTEMDPAKFEQQIEYANEIYHPAGIQFHWDPRNFLLMNSTLHNRDCTVGGHPLTVDDVGEVLSKEDFKNSKLKWKTVRNKICKDANDTVDCDQECHKDARKRLASIYPGLMIVYWLRGDSFKFNAAKNHWEPSHRTYGTSGIKRGRNYVDLPKTIGGGGAICPHEFGHYLGLDHPFKKRPKTIADAQKQIVKYLETNPPDDDVLSILYDGDKGSVDDTPPDPGGEFFESINPDGDRCGAVDQSNIFVWTQVNGEFIFNQYLLKPDRRNIMSYFKRCKALGQRHTRGQRQIMRDNLLNGVRKHLLDPPMHPALKVFIEGDDDGPF